jgi:hypothetical protein
VRILGGTLADVVGSAAGEWLPAGCNVPMREEAGAVRRQSDMDAADLLCG